VLREAYVAEPEHTQPRDRAMLDSFDDCSDGELLLHLLVSLGGLLLDFALAPANSTFKLTMLTI
jgi:hypothetical protein